MCYVVTAHRIQTAYKFNSCLHT